MHVSERRACAALGQHRSTQRKVPRGRPDEEQLTADLIALARQYGRYGYRKIAGLLEQAGWLVNDKRVERIWRREGLKVPRKQPKRGRLWLNDGSCIRLRAERPNHVWSYDFVEDRTHEGRKYRMLNIVDEFTHECLAIRIDRKLKSADVHPTSRRIVVSDWSTVIHLRSPVARARTRSSVHGRCGQPPVPTLTAGARSRGGVTPTSGRDGLPMCIGRRRPAGLATRARSASTTRPRAMVRPDPGSPRCRRSRPPAS